MGINDVSGIIWHQRSEPPRFAQIIKSFVAETRRVESSKRMENRRRKVICVGQPMTNTAKPLGSIPAATIKGTNDTDDWELMQFARDFLLHVKYPSNCLSAIWTLVIHVFFCDSNSTFLVD
jgi:hypothetical protein